MVDIDILRYLMIDGKSFTDIETPEEFLATSWNTHRPFLDGDLQKEINKVRSSISGPINIDLKEVGILMEALRSEQYRGFLKHVLTEFSGEPENTIYPVRSKYTGIQCCVCGKPLLYWKEWKDTCKVLPESMSENTHMHYLAYGTAGSGSLCICRDCLVQIKYLHDILEAVDPGILNFRKSTPGGLKA